MRKALLLQTAFALIAFLFIPILFGLNAAAQSPFQSSSDQDADKAKLRSNYNFRKRAYPFGEIPADWKLKALEHIRKNVRISPQSTETLTPIGPAPMLNGRTFVERQDLSGRITSLAVDPNNPLTVYLGAAQGGVWKSTNGGKNWSPMTDSAPTQAIGSVMIDPKDSNTIYAGTGEGNFSGDSFFGMGILKSTDGGQTWTNLAAKDFVGRAINKLIADPSNTNVVYATVAAAFAGISSELNPDLAVNGVAKSTDAGSTWVNVFKAGTTALGSSCFDLEIDVSTPSTLFAAINGQGIFRTTDAGQNWSKLTNGLPSTGFDRPDIGISKSNPKILYASFGNLQSGDLLDIFKSKDGGDSWIKIAQPPPGGFNNNVICQCFYDNFIDVDPTNPDIVYYGGVGMYKSTNGGSSWVDISKGTTGLHSDAHAIAFTSGKPDQFYVGNDGGVSFTADGGSTFVSRNTSLNITQFQSISIHPTNPKISIGGTQDNGTNIYQGSISWERGLDGDGGFTAIDQSNPDVVYSTFFNTPGSYSPQRSRSGGKLGTWITIDRGIGPNDSVLFYAPLILDPNNQSTLYFGTSRLYRSTNQGDQWSAVSGDLTGNLRGSAIASIAVAQTDSKTIYTGSDSGIVFASFDGGRSFQNVTGNLPARFISDIAIDPSSPKTVYVSLSGFKAGKVFRSTTGGGDWKDISANLPDVPANALAINQGNTLNIFVGTDVGLFRTDDGGASWTLVSGMPSVSVFDIALSSKLGIVRIATHGRGVYELEIPKAILRPTITNPVFQSGKLKFSGSNISSGANLIIVNGSARESFAFTASGTKFVIKKSIKSTPTGLTVTQAIPSGTAVQLIVRNPDGVESNPISFTR